MLLTSTIQHVFTINISTTFIYFSTLYVDYLHCRAHGHFLDNVQSEENRLERILWCVCGVGSELGMVLGSKPEPEMFFRSNL